MNLKQINIEMAKELACIDDLLMVIKLHTQDGRYDLAEERIHDLLKSNNYMRKLDGQAEEQRQLRNVVVELNKRGILAKVVKRYEELVR